MIKNKLIVEYEYDFQLIGLVCSLKDYKLAWILNKVLRIKLSKEPDIVFDFLDTSHFSISNYRYSTEHGTFRLLKNRAYDNLNTKKPYLIPEMKQYDYFVTTEYLEELFSKDELLERLKEIEHIILATHINIYDLKSKENLIF